MLNWAARIVYQAKKYEHVTCPHGTTHWLPTEQRINLKILLITFKVLHNQASTYLIDLLTHYHTLRLLYSSAKNLLWNPTYNLQTYDGCSFAVVTPLLWNPLLQSVKDSILVDTFKVNVDSKKHLFLSAYNRC